MVFAAITSGEITTGEPVSNNTQTKVKDNFDNHETRITALEGGATTVYPPIVMRLYGPYSGLTINDLIRETINFNITITGIRLIIGSCGTSGTTEVGVEFKRAAGAWTSLLTTNPSVAFGAGDNAVSSNAVLNASNVNLQAGDLIRVNNVSTQLKALDYMVRIDYNKT